MNPTVCIYTAVCGGYDDLKPQPEQTVPCDFVCFTDEPERTSAPPWLVLPLDPTVDGPARLRSRLAKVLPHRVFDPGRYDFTIWIDASVNILRAELAERMIAALTATGLAVVEHPESRGLSPVIARDMRDERVRASDEAWWGEARRRPARDPLSAALNGLGVDYTPVGLDPWRNPLFEVWPHLSPFTGDMARRTRPEYSAEPLPERRAGDRPGVYAPAAGRWHLPGAARRIEFSYGPPALGLVELMGDWDGDGVDGPGLYDPATGTFFLRNGRGPGDADATFVFGPPGAVPVAGDWDGDGRDSVGIFLPEHGAFALTKRNEPGSADVELFFGAPGTSMLPVAGDWDGRGRDRVGLYIPESSGWLLLDELATGAPVSGFTFGPERGVPVVGDWNGDGVDEVGVYVPEQGQAFLARANRSSSPCWRAILDPPGGRPVACRWTGGAGRRHRDESAEPADVRNLSRGDVGERVLPEDLLRAPDHVARYAFAAHWAAGCLALDLCCGVGYGSALLAAAGARRVVGVDVSPDAIRYAAGRYASATTEFVCRDATGEPPVSRADLVTCFEAVEHVRDPDALLATIATVLDPSGIAFVSSPNGAYYPGGFSGNPHHVKEYTRGEFRALLDRYFDRVELFCQALGGEPTDAANAAYRLRPIPAAGVPEEPLVWVAACREPRQ